MMNELIAVSTGLLAGTVTGIVPGAGVMVAMIVATPLLMSFDIIQLLLFYVVSQYGSIHRNDSCRISWNTW